VKVIVSAGGTGGHIYPSLAIIDEIKRMEPNSEFLFIGTDNRMEKDIVPSYGIDFVGLKIIGFNRKLTINNVVNLKNIYLAIKKCKKIMREFKPDVVIGTGGYVTFPVIFAASSLKVPTLIHEQNSVFGLANKMLLNRVTKVALAIPIDNIKYKEKAFLSGNPCSESAFNVEKASKKEYGLDENKKLVVIAMGSSGSESINSKMDLSKFKDKNYEVVFVTGEKHYGEVIKNNVANENVQIVPYIKELTKLLKVTDVFISRAGATILSEIIAIGVVSVLIPSPYVPNNHQFKNATSLVENDAAILFEEKDFNMDTLLNKIDGLLIDEKRSKEISRNLGEMPIKNSAAIIFKKIQEMVYKND